MFKNCSPLMWRASKLQHFIVKVRGLSKFKLKTLRIQISTKILFCNWTQMTRVIKAHTLPYPEIEMYQCCVVIWIQDELPVPVFKLFQIQGPTSSGSLLKNQELKKPSLQSFLKNQWVSSKNRQSTHGSMAGYLKFEKYENCGYISEPGLWYFLSTVVTNLKESPW